MSKFNQFTPEVEDIVPANIFPVRFWKAYDYNADGTVKKESEWCEWAKKGTGIPTGTVDKVDRLRKDKAIWLAIGPGYEQWQAGQEPVGDGTPLDIWPGLQDHERELLAGHKIRTLEDFAALTDGDIERLGFPGARLKRDRAAEYLGKVDAIDQVAALKDEIARLKAAKEAPTAADDEYEDLKAEARARGIKLDGRWSAERLREEIKIAKERSAA